ncbi:hypothetical protein [Leifsonia sp. Root4]|uniref:hypothetical protein n=1 Tax=Leifsonia sp. Root4 TaxID=1736525 RepID=UPI0012F8CEF0|nr:hypothetical protein [Leifsonia sp. Root4]
MTIIVFYASLLTLLGTGWQMFSAKLQGLYTLEDFQADLNKLERESASEALSSIPRWNLPKRRRLANRARADAHHALTKDERRRSKMYDRQAMGWAMLMVGSALALVAAAGAAMSA